MSVRRSVAVVCDGCYDTTPPMAEHVTGTKAREHARDLFGWSLESGVDLCPECLKAYAEVSTATAELDSGATLPQTTGHGDDVAWRYS